MQKQQPHKKNHQLFFTHQWWIFPDVFDVVWTVCIRLSSITANSFGCHRTHRERERDVNVLIENPTQKFCAFHLEYLIWNFCALFSIFGDRVRATNMKFAHFRGVIALCTTSAVLYMYIGLAPLWSNDFLCVKNIYWSLVPSRIFFFFSAREFRCYRFINTFFFLSYLSFFLITTLSNVFYFRQYTKHLHFLVCGRLFHFFTIF